MARGYLLVEAMMTISILTVLGLVLLKLSINILHPRQWTLQQTVTDAYMTYERSFAERVPFDTLVATGSPWPLYPTVTTSNVTLGKLPGGLAITGTVSRTRTADPTNNLAVDGGTGTEDTSNPALIKIWKAQSVLTYKVGKRTYVKSRTVLRSQ